MYAKEPESIRSSIILSLDNLEMLGISNFIISSPSFWIITYKIFLFHGVIKKNNYKIRNYNNKHILESNFFKFLKFLKRKGNFLSVDEICYHVINKINLPKNTFCITFDDGFENNFSIARPILKSLNVPATFYLTSNFIDKNIWTFINWYIYIYWIWNQWFNIDIGKKFAKLKISII